MKIKVVAFSEGMLRGMLRGCASGYASPKSNIPIPALHKLNTFKKKKKGQTHIAVLRCSHIEEPQMFQISLAKGTTLVGEPQLFIADSFSAVGDFSWTCSKTMRLKPSLVPRAAVSWNTQIWSVSTS